VSEWEGDERPTQPCVVCGAIPDRTVDLPSRPDVHLAFASGALCAECALLAESGAGAGLTARARANWDEDEPAQGIVTLVLAAFGNPPPVRIRSAPTPLSAQDLAIWHGLEPLMYDGPGPEVVVRGRISSADADGEFVVHRAGNRARLERADGTPIMRTDGVTTWHFTDHGVISAPYRDDDGMGGVGALAFRRTRQEVDAFSFGTPIGPIEATTYLDRPAWRFAFAAPPHKPYDMQVVVDAETGFVLDRKFAGGSHTRWLEFVTDEPSDPALFRWDGPSLDRAELRAGRDREHQQDMARRASWFADNVAPGLTFAGARLEVTLHEWDDDGSFQASCDTAEIMVTLARRPRSPGWWELGWSTVDYRWSDERWDWAMSNFGDEPVDPDEVAAFRRQLSSAGP